MSRPLRAVAPDAAFHVIARGNARTAIFLDNQDRVRFLELVAAVVDRYVVVCHAYCLLDNHYHLLLETPQANLSIAMRQLNGVYAAYLNRRHGRCGHVFQGRFRSILVEKESHLLAVARYVVLNPVRAGICAEADAYVWSSYRATAGLCARPPFLTTDWLLAVFGRNPVEARARYRTYISDRHAGSQLVVGERIGTEAFLRRRLGDEASLEVPRAEIEPLSPPLEHLFATNETPVATAYRRHHYSLAQIAAHLGCHYSTVSRRLCREEAALHECKT